MKIVDMIMKIITKICTVYWESIPVQNILDVPVKIWTSNLIVSGFAGCKVPNKVTNMFVTHDPNCDIHTIFQNTGNDATRQGVLLHELAHIKLGHLEMVLQLYTAGKITTPIATLDMEMEADRWVVEQGYGPQLLLGLIDLYEVIRTNPKANNLWHLDLRIKELREQVFN